LTGQGGFACQTYVWKRQEIKLDYPGFTDNQRVKSMKVEISIGEFLDKLTILQIKSERITDPEKLKSIHKELALLQDTWKHSPHAGINLDAEIADLKKINESLWEIEDDIRDKEREKTFDQKFIELARSVYISNDKRAAIKRTINMKAGSELMEEKSYAGY